MPSWRPAGGRGGSGLGGGAAVVLLQEPVEDLDAGDRGHGPAGHLPVGVEAVGEIEVVPAVGGGDDGVELDVDGAHAVHVRVGAGLQAGIVDEVVEPGQPEIAAQHDLAPLGVQRAADRLQLRRGLGSGEGLEHIRRRVASPNPQSRPISDSPVLMKR